MLGIALLFTILCALFGAAFVAVCEKGQYRRAFWLKGLAGVCFVAAGLSFAIEQAGPAFPRLIFFGLVFGLIGDQLLALRFIHPERHDVFLISGAAAFAIGHGMYIAAMWSLDSGAWLFALLFLAVGLAAAVAADCPSAKKTGSMRMDPNAMWEAETHTGTSRFAHSPRLGTIAP